MKKKSKKEPTIQEKMEMLFLGKRVIGVKENLSWNTLYLEMEDGTYLTLRADSHFSVYWATPEDRIKDLKTRIEHGEQDVNEKKTEVARIEAIVGEYNATQHSSKKKA